MSEHKIKIGISQGDINGIGIEVIIKTFLDPQMLDICTPILFSSQKTISYHRKALGIEDFSFNPIKDIASANAKKANVITCYEEEANIELGQPSLASAKYALKSLEMACNALERGELDALVTAPINKHTIQSDSFSFPGHTEYLEQRYGKKGDALMFMVSDRLKVALATGHIPLSEASKKISIEGLLLKIKSLNKSLVEDFGLNRPRIALLGINPHAGDSGTLGSEEQQIIIPAIQKAKEENLLIFGPYSADGFFGSSAYLSFDAVLAMYHDQGLIPFKALAFESGVNFTAGLSIIRTSPDHGTGYDIAGKNKASEESFRQAIYTACDVFKNRLLYKNISANPLQISKQRKER